MKSRKKRFLDILCERYPEIERKELYSLILCGEVSVNNEKRRDPSCLILSDARIDLQFRKYVSRGGLKLEKALNEWGIDVCNKVVLDAGCSTGGFTDCLLQHGAAMVFSVDVGFNQLDYKLRQNEKVRVYEKTNIMDIQSLVPIPNFAVADISFRSIRNAASHILDLTKEKELIALIKPQFEIPKEYENFNGVIRDVKILEDVLISLSSDLFGEKAFIQAVTESPIAGKKGGNREFLFYLKNRQNVSIENIQNEIRGLLY